MNKVRAHGIVGHIGKWIEEWLSGRKQRVVLNGCESTWSDVTPSVPQGSVLGPTLFIIFINDIDSAVDTFIIIKKFADDTKFGCQVDSIEQSVLLQQELNNVFRWSEQWQMLFNLDKCVVMHLGAKNSEFNYLYIRRTTTQYNRNRKGSRHLHSPKSKTKCSYSRNCKKRQTRCWDSFFTHIYTPRQV